MPKSPLRMWTYASPSGVRFTVQESGLVNGNMYIEGRGKGSELVGSVLIREDRLETFLSFMDEVCGEGIKAHDECD